MLSDGLHLLFSRFTLSEWFKWNVLQWSDQAVVGGTHKKVLNSLNLYFNKKRPQSMRQHSENNMLCLFWSESKQLVQRLKPNLFNRTQVQTLTCPSVPGRPFVCRRISAHVFSHMPSKVCVFLHVFLTDPPANQSFKSVKNAHICERHRMEAQGRGFKSTEGLPWCTPEQELPTVGLSAEDWAN